MAGEPFHLRPLWAGWQPSAKAYFRNDAFEARTPYHSSDLAFHRRSERMTRHSYKAGITVTRPMVAGWDGLLPAWWSDLDPRFRRPKKAIAGVVLTMMVVSIFSLWGAANQEAYDLTTSAALVATAIEYLLLFATVLFGFRSSAEPPGIGLRLGALTALVVVFLSALFEIVPLSNVNSRGVYAAKVIALTCVVNGLGVYLYWRGSRRLTPRKQIRRKTKK